ncbi:RNA polymerase II C-terminal domain phosphatase-like protein, partial [Zostera marina]
DEMHKDKVSTNHMNLNIADGSAKPSLPIAVLHEIGRICDSKVEFKDISRNANDLLFSVEVMFGNEKVGVGMGGTKIQARDHAADNALHKLSYHYMEFVRSTNRLISPELDNFRHEKDNGFLYDDSDDYDSNVTKRDDLAISTKADIPKLDDSQRLGTAISEIKDLLSANEDTTLVFREHPPSSVVLIKGEYYSQVEVNDRVLGKGISTSKEGAKRLAAEDALKSLMVSDDHQSQNHLHSSWNSQSGIKRSWDQVAGQKS